jgi:HAD superfamily hydrolase (TIGR01509 family)
MRKAVVFDMDGIVIDSEPIHSLAFKEVLSEYGVPYVTDEIVHVPGLGSKENWEILKERFGFEEDTSVLVAKRRQAYLRALKNRLEPRPGLLKLLDELAEKGYALALATSSTSSVDVVLDGLNIRRYFDAVVGGTEVTKTKPDPEIFLKVAIKLDNSTEECLAIEDAVAGMKAAKRAGMKCIAVPTSCTIADDFSEADLVLDSLEYINAGVVAAILK